MNVYEIIIRPLSGFGTSLKGDTLFGHFCWQVAHDRKLLGVSIEEFLAGYGSQPHLIFSSANLRISKYESDEDAIVFKRPEMPLEKLFDFSGMRKIDRIRERKEIKARRWMVIKKKQKFEGFKSLSFLSDRELLGLYLRDNSITLQHAEKLVISQSVWHNSIDRKSGMTGEGRFAPYSLEQNVFFPDVELSVFAGIDDSLEISQVAKGIERIGESGFGRDSSTGAGKFEVRGVEKHEGMGSEEPNALYTLSPSVPEKKVYFKKYFNPFTRFGKHGDVLSKSANPFKNPIIMADEGAVLMPAPDLGYIFEKPYMGTAISGISKKMPGAVAQGYSLYIPLKVEV